MAATPTPSTRPSAGAVLVVTETDDLTADMVIAELNQREIPVARVNPSDFGDRLTMSARFGTSEPGAAEPGAESPTGRLATPSRTVELDQVRSVYWRRPTWPAFEHLDDEDARYATAQVRHGLGGTLYALPHALYVNHPLRNHAADFKPAQLALAERLGLAIAPTLVSNRIEDIRDFITAHDQVIYKSLRWTPYRRGEVNCSTWTEPVTVDELDESVIVTPHLFQACIDKIADVRVTIVGEQIFAVRIDSDLLDWRADYSALSYTVVDLPARLEKTLQSYLEHCGLVFGCFDLAIDAAGEYTWIELNPNGQWGWLETEAGVPITAAITDLLERGCP